MPAFRGDTAELNENVFECHGDCATRPQYKKTLDALYAYVKIRMPYPEDLRPLFQDNITLPEISPLMRPTGPDIDELDKFDYMEARKEYNKRQQQLLSNLAALFALIIGQCSDAMRAKLKSVDQWTTAFVTNNCQWLFQQIRGVTLEFDHTKSPLLSLIDVKEKFISCRQRPQDSLEAYLEVLRTWAEMLETYGGSIVEGPFSVNNPLLPGTPEHAEARERALGMTFFRNADPVRYGALQTDISNSFAMGIDRYRHYQCI